MSERRACPEPIRSHAHAAEKLGDAPFLAYCLIQGFKLTISLLGKRWPELR
jgi:hypothetical protein